MPTVRGVVSRGVQCPEMKVYIYCQAASCRVVNMVRNLLWSEHKKVWDASAKRFWLQFLVIVRFLEFIKSQAYWNLHTREFRESWHLDVLEVTSISRLTPRLFDRFSIRCCSSVGIGWIAVCIPFLHGGE
jgi:hypothetical protein